ncbi:MULTISPECIES: DUF1844 domain-containing protein [Acidobacterium]|uniref:DUF1844 domain-containing protein n=2 Tax=Acidobacterium capsulatum TaxID=33075 RepID=C1F6C2_ACIC5|nr:MULTISPECIES: DUF1844 domain-containing protein [Acidobacterium]ACO33080.1 hypothetical protein ACP_3354 [Acidobacterium capsulatum ATCC 51196]
MDEKPPAFTVTDRRKFTFDGDLRDGETTASPSEAAKTLEPQAVAPESAPEAAPKAAKVVSMPRREPEPEAAATPEPVVAHTDAAAEAATEEDQPAPITAEESAEQHAAYQASSQQLDDMLKQANPGMQASGPVTFDHVVQSIYLSAMIAMGAGTEPGQKPRIDILGARQSIDMLSVLQEKTKGNLSEREQTLLQSALFELRMMFLEITNAISKAAHQPPPGQK